MAEQLTPENSERAAATLVGKLTVLAYADQSVSVVGLAGIEPMEVGILMKAIRYVEKHYEAAAKIRAENPGPPVEIASGSQLPPYYGKRKL